MKPIQLLVRAWVLIQGAAHLRLLMKISAKPEQLKLVCLSIYCAFSPLKTLPSF